MTSRFSLTLPSCGSCVSHSHCLQCLESLGRSVADKAPVEAFSIEPEGKILILQSPLDAETLTDLLDDMGIFAEETL